MTVSNFEQVKRVTVMGLGLFGGGVGVAEYWAKKGAKVVVTDLRGADILAPSIEALQQYDIEYILEKHRECDFTNCDLLIVNPAVQPGNKFVALALSAGVPVTTEVGLFINEHQNIGQNPILAITGSNGKSTTTALLSSILEEMNNATLSGGNIGISLLSRLGTYPAQTPAILELSSFQLHYLAKESFAPEIAIITNLAPNHLDWHKTLDNYYNDKKSILDLQSDESYVILNYNDPVLREWAETANARVVFSSLQDTGCSDIIFIRNNEFVIRHEGTEHILAPLSALQLPGTHNQENALQALAAAFIYNQHLEKKQLINEFADGLNSFTGLNHRQEVVDKIGEVLFINDSIATTPESTIAALNSYNEKEIVIIAGGYDKSIPLELMCREITNKAKSAVLIGQTAPKIYEFIKSQNPEFDATIISESDLSTAVNLAFSKTTTGVVILSPGCASYGMFTNFQDRGNKFKESVHILKRSL